MRAADARVASEACAALYAGLRPVVSAHALGALPEALRDRLRVAPFAPARLVEDLRGSRRDALLERETALLDALVELGDAELASLRDVPVLRDSTGDRTAVSEGLVDPAPWLAEVAPSLARAVPLVDADLRARHPRLVARWVPTFGLAELADALDAGHALADGPARRLARILDARALSLPRSLARRLAAHPLFEDVHGSLRPLFGAGAARWTRDPTLAEALSGWPWLADPVRPIVAAVEPPQVDAAHLARALVGEAEPGVPADALEAVFRWLARHADELSARRVDGLGDASVWLDRDGRTRPLRALRRGAGGAAIDAYYRAAGGRWVAHPASLALADALRLGTRLPTSDHAAVVADLVALGEAPAIDRALVVDVLLEASERLPPQALAPLTAVRLFEDEGGTRRRLGRWTDPDPEACHRPGRFRAALRAGDWPLLAAAEETRWAPLLDAVGPPPATARDLAGRAATLLGDPEALLAALEAGADALTDEDRAALAELPLLPARSGRRHAARALCDPAPFVEALGEARVEALALDDAWASGAALASAATIGLALRAGAALLPEAIVEGLRPGEPLAAQPAPWRGPEDLWALCALHGALGVAARDAPLALDATGALAAGPLWTAGEPARRLVDALPDDVGLLARLADPTWAEGADPSLVAPLPARRLAEALRAAFPDEAPRDGHPLDVPALLQWLREQAEALAADEAALGALGAAAVLPSQRGTLRAPRDLVLDPSLPDLGLDWGLAPEVPADLARWLADTYELDLRARRAIVAHVLSGIDGAAEDDDAARAAELVRFLARALGAPQVDDATLERRARRSKTRARLKVPVQGGGWDKPRFAWAPSDEVADHAEEFAADLPPRIALRGLDAPARRLLAACGARADLDEATVDALLDGDGLLEGPAARRALARYVALRALTVPARAESWRLARRDWVPDREGTLRRPEALLWPDELAEALFGGDPTRFPDAQVTFDLPEEAAARLGFGRAASLSLDEVARHAADREASPALLDWLEDGLRAGRLETVEVRRALRDRILVRDDGGTPRRPREVACADAERLFGRWRGDLSVAVELPRLARALEIPDTPDAPMILHFVVEVGDALPELSEAAREDLARRLPGCFERLGEAAEAGTEVRLPAGAAVAAMSRGRSMVTRIGEPALRMLEPLGLAEGLDDADAFLDPLPSFDRSAALARLLQAAGVPDLWAVFRVEAAVPGPAREDLADAAEALRASLAAVLGDAAVGTKARVVDGLVTRGVLELAPRGGYRSASRLEAETEAPAVVHGGTLLLTAEVLREPALLAPALARDPERRAATARWLEAGDWARAPKKVERAPTRDPATRAPSEGLWSRLKRVFSSPEPRPRPAASPPTRGGEGTTGQGFFRPQADVSSQLERTEGWLEDRRIAPDFGFAFTPSRLPSPWLYAPKLVATRFDRRGQRWCSAAVRRPEARGDAGALSMRGRLPKGDALMPVPLYGRLDEVRVEGGDATTVAGPSGGTVLRLDRPGEVRLRLTLGAVPDLGAARAPAGATQAEALGRFVPDDELPEEVLDFVADLDPADAPVERAFAIRDFVRARYRYDPSYLEDAAVGRWLAKVTRGRANAHVAALHAAGDARHLGAGVCYELNALACELLRRAAIPAAIATGWVLEGGALSEPDHLWALALLEDAAGAPVWVPIDASTTATGRPLRVPRRPAGRFRKPREKTARAPKAPRWALDPGTGRGRGGDGRSERARKPKKPKKRRPPRAELRRLVRHLERVAKRRVEPDELEALEAALQRPSEASRLLDRLLED
ncbi:MAG TPA: transglutaminase domain-containing protein [Sandaracinaceae bacterium LLY-WYZ-13_1]|nr:transglutaminase domain-containing protein [Sandaracinaceae bacterium LLY-WYZ-13_1]